MTTTARQTKRIRDDLDPHTTAVGASGVFGRDALAEMVADSVRRITRSARGLSPREHQLFKDLKKGRYIGGVLNALEISQQKCEDVADATALPEAFRGFVLAGHQGFHTCVYDAFRMETDANGAADLAQLEYAISPTKANRQRAIEALNRQAVETRKALDALHRDEASGTLSLHRSS